MLFERRKDIKFAKMQAFSFDFNFYFNVKTFAGPFFFIKWTKNYSDGY